MYLLPESSLIKSSVPSGSYLQSKRSSNLFIHLSSFSVSYGISFSPIPIHFYTYPPPVPPMAMPINEFLIGIETEGFWKGKAGSNLPGLNVEKKHFAQALVPRYNHIRKDMLRADFSHGSHPGHYEDPGNQKQWIVAIDDAIGDFGLSSSFPEGRTYSTTLCGVTISIRLTTIQMRLNLSPQN